MAVTIHPLAVDGGLDRQARVAQPQMRLADLLGRERSDGSVKDGSVGAL
jgi:hypothetical protein